MMNRLLVLLALLGLASCRGSEPQPLEILGSDPRGTSMVVGGGASPFVAYARYDPATLGQSVRVLRHDAARPDDIEVVGDLALTVSEPSPCLFVSGNVLVGWGAAGLVAVDLADPSLPETALPLSSTPDALAAEGRWLLAGSGATLTLVDLGQSAPPRSWAAPALVTSIVAVQGTFVAFTTSGYVHVVPDAASPTFEARADAVVRNFAAVFADGAEAIAAGPAAALGKARVVRLDLRAPAAPVALRAHEVDGQYAFFAWDGGATSIVAIGPGDFGGVDDGYALTEQGDAFTSRGIPLPMTTFASPNAIAAHAGRLFVVTIGGIGFGIFRIL